MSAVSSALIGNEQLIRVLPSSVPACCSTSSTLDQCTASSTASASRAASAGVPARARAPASCASRLSLCSLRAKLNTTSCPARAKSVPSLAPMRPDPSMPIRTATCPRERLCLTDTHLLPLCSRGDNQRLARAVKTTLTLDVSSRARRTTPADEYRTMHTRKLAPWLIAFAAWLGLAAAAMAAADAEQESDFKLRFVGPKV